MKVMNITTPHHALSVRSAQPSDFAAIERIEAAADQLFIEAFAPAHWPPATPAVDRLEQGGFLLVGEACEARGAEIVGFVHVLEAQDDRGSGIAHLEQVSVLPGHGKRGYGRALVEAAMHEARGLGYAELTLRTYADLPWNAPFYRGLGFTETAPNCAFLMELEDAERAEGLEQYGRRVQMTAPLT